MSLTESLRAATELNKQLVATIETLTTRNKDRQRENKEHGWHECALAYEAKHKELGLNITIIPNPYQQPPNNTNQQQTPPNQTNTK